MAITNGYTTLVLMRALLDITDVTDTSDDARIEACVEAASRLIDNKCGRFFWKATAATKYFTAKAPDYLDGLDILDVTTISLDTNGDLTHDLDMAATDFVLEPFDADDHGKPYTTIRIAPLGNYSFVTTAKGVKIVGNFGWDSVPTPIVEACKIQALRIFGRKDAIYGVSGGDEMGKLQTVGGLDKDVIELIYPYIKAEF